jgi:hypothetical protein
MVAVGHFSCDWPGIWVKTAGTVNPRSNHRSPAHQAISKLFDIAIAMKALPV